MLTTAATNAAPPTTLVELAGLEKSFGLVHAVRGIDLTVAPGEVVAVLGPNGAGKSTTLDMLLGLTVPDRGRVSLLGQTPEEAIRTGTVGAMLQTGGLVRDLTVRELLAMIGSLYPAPLDLDDLLALTGVTEFADQRTHKLSGGQTQRARFALALVSDPDLLVLDEPTVAMDVKSRQVFWSSMRALGRRAKTVIFATHYLEEADLYADRIVLLAQGRVVADGPTTEIKAMVGTRTIEATLPGADPAALTAIPGVSACQVRGDVVTLTCADADTALRGLLPAYPAMHDIEVRGAGLDEAFLQLTTDTTTEEGA
ncbi:MAG TPA: ABC transporter ATP-binding protein [Acidimicrobiales bacterium]|nr:ABC transporter ATP-binding protein [Acidimicrobiales bacterium]